MKEVLARPARQAFFERTLQRDRVESMKMVASGVSRTLQKRPATATGQSCDHKSLCLDKPPRTSAEGFGRAKERRALSRRHRHGGHVPMQFGVWEFCDPSPEALGAVRFVSGMQKATEPANTHISAAPTSHLMDRGRSYAASVQKRSRFPSSRPKPIAAEGDGTRHSSDDTFRKISDWQQLCEGAMKGWSPGASPVWHGNVGPTAQDLLIIRPASASQRDLHSAVPSRSPEFCEASSARMPNLGGMAYCPPRPKSASTGCRQRSVEMTLHGKTPPVASGRHENLRRPKTARRRGTENVLGQPVIEGRKIVIKMSGGTGGEILMQVDDAEGGRGEILRSTSVSGSHSADDAIPLQNTMESATPDGQNVSKWLPADAGPSTHVEADPDTQDKQNVNWSGSEGIIVKSELQTQCIVSV